ncbi:FkbM family methyltransferase [Flavobacterium enshiense]|uniref:FkbM family methyltransferase n=1 Tax=Flavobacterium enshiense TaxID=1341165 RepID=UPI00345DC934
MDKVFKFLFYRVSVFLNVNSQKVIRYFEKKENESDNLKWKHLFKKDERILYPINKTLQIYLYKDSILSRFIYKGNFEEQELKCMLSNINEGDTFIDIGANIGLFSLLAAEKVGASGKVISFEPFPNTFKRLTDNIELNKLKNIDARNIGLSDKEDSLTFYYSDTGFDAWNSFAPTNDKRLRKEISIGVSTLDNELESVDKSKVKFVKIDVEGWEKFVIQGGKQFFSEYSPIVMVEFTEENTLNAGYFVNEIFGLLENLGYEWYRIDGQHLVKEIKQTHYPYDNLIAKKKA